MRYISQYQRLDLIAIDGTILHRFKNGVLQIGDPTLNTAGNVIPVTFVASKDSLNYTNLYPALGTDIQRAGLGNIFWEAPPLTNAATLTVNAYYKVLTGSVTYKTVVYKAGDVFQCVTGTTAFTGSGTIALDVPHEYKTSIETNFRSQNFVDDHLAIGDESSWDEQNWGAIQDTNLGAIR